MCAHSATLADNPFAHRSLRSETDPAPAFARLLGELAGYLERRRGAGGGADGADGAGVVVDARAVADVVAELTRNEDDRKQESLCVVSAFDTPKFSLEASTGSYVYRGRSFPLHADAAAKLALHEERLALVHARLMRMTVFQAPLPGVKRDYLQLSRVDDLAVISERERFVNMLGMLTQPEDGLFCLEDASGMSVALDLTNIHELSAGLFTETCVVLVNGFYYPDEQPPGFEPGGERNLAAAEQALPAQAPSSSSSHSSSSAASSSSYATDADMSIPHASVHGGVGVGGVGGGATQFSALTDSRLPGVLRVKTLGHPMPESRATTLRAMAIVDPLRAFSTPAEFEHVQALMEGSADAQRSTFAVLADVHLDRPEVLAGLRHMLTGLARADSVPAMFVLMGGFASRPYGQHAGDRALYTAGFEALAALLADFPDVCSRAHFVFVPGPGDWDPGAARVLPRPPLPPSIVASLVGNPAVPRVTFTSNPCRVRFFTQELVFFRQDLSMLLRRQALLTPSKPEAEAGGGSEVVGAGAGDGEAAARPMLGTEHMQATVLRQAHLCPLPLQVQPVFWEHDHALRLSPMPDVVVIGENEEQYEYRDEALDAAAPLFLNPGSFATSLDFVIYAPATGDVSFSCASSSAAE